MDPFQIEFEFGGQKTNATVFKIPGGPLTAARFDVYDFEPPYDLIGKNFTFTANPQTNKMEFSGFHPDALPYIEQIFGALTKYCHENDIDLMS